jgi:DNA (cytosine-5)-methyltransferase 1
VAAVPVPVIGLFSGAGGLEIGAARAGAHVRLSVEVDPAACETLRQNRTHHGGNVLEADVASIHGKDLRSLADLSKNEKCVVIGGPPCQPFSKAAYWTDPGDDFRFRQARANGKKAERPQPITTPRPDERRHLVGEFLRLVVEVEADGFLFENVPSIAHPRNRKMLQHLLKSFQMSGYATTFMNANAFDYGVPQKRHRVFLLGTRSRKPPPESQIFTQLTRNQSPSRPTAGHALAPFQGLEFFEPEEVVVGRWAEQLREIPPGGNYKALTAWAGHSKPVFEAETRFWHFLLKLSPNLPSWTIPANPGPWVGPFHWDSRLLRIPELAASNDNSVAI